MDELRRQQDLIARLYCDAAFRQEFFLAPITNGRAFGLTDERIREIADVIPDEIEFFAKSLVWKRMRAVEKMLPLTTSVLGAEFYVVFEKFANEFVPRTVKKHFEDAVAFTGFVTGSFEGREIRAAARYERARLEFYGDDRRIRWCVVEQSIRARIEGRDTEHSSGRRTVAVWIRTGRRVRHFFV